MTLNSFCINSENTQLYMDREEPGVLQSMSSQKGRHDLATEQ